jgi:hypothetical protein
VLGFSAVRYSVFKVQFWRRPKILAEAMALFWAYCGGKWRILAGKFLRQNGDVLKLFWRFVADYVRRYRFKMVRFHKISWMAFDFRPSTFDFEAFSDK